MQYSAKKQSWLEFINESLESHVKNEVVDHNVNDMRFTQMNKINYSIMAPPPYPNSNFQHPSIRIPSFEIQQQQQNELANRMSAGNMSTIIKQQPRSPISYTAFPSNFYNHHRQSITSSENEQLSPTSNHIAESSSTATLIPSSATNDGKGGGGGGGGGTSLEDKRRCAICSDVASGYHYGVWSCEGCKAFFKRSIQGNNDYICPATNTCTIDKHRRKSCQACRLRRCYEVGMTKGTTRRDRKYRKKAVSVCKITSTSSNSNAMTMQTNLPNEKHGLLVSNTNTRTSTGTPSGSQFNNNSNTFSSPQPQMNKTTSDSTRIPITTAAFLSTLSQASRLNLPAKVDTSRSLNDEYFLQLLAKIFDQELVVLINWAKAMPGYTESLTLDEQVTIIEQSWLDTLLLDIIERSLERNDDALQFAPDFLISRNRDLSSPVLGSVCTYLFNILQAFKEPRTTHEEFIALKAAILVNSIPASIASTKSFRLLTNQIYETIRYTCDSNPSVYRDNYIRHFTVLLQLPHIKMLSSKLIRLFLYMRNNELLPQADLLLEMLDAQDTFDISFNNQSEETEHFNQPSTSFNIDNFAVYQDQYSNISTIEMDKDNISDLS